MQEQRQFVRLDTRLGVTYQVAGSPVSSVTKDISAGGICVFLNDVLQPGTSLRIEIQLPERPQPIAFIGEVAWCDSYEIVGRGQRERSIEAGIKFSQIDPQDRQTILQHVILGLQAPSQ